MDAGIAFREEILLDVPSTGRFRPPRIKARRAERNATRLEQLALKLIRQLEDVAFLISNGFCCPWRKKASTKHRPPRRGIWQATTTEAPASPSQCLGLSQAFPWL